MTLTVIKPPRNIYFAPDRNLSVLVGVNLWLFCGIMIPFFKLYFLTSDHKNKS